MARPPSFGAASEGGGDGEGLSTLVARAEKQKQNREIYFPWKILKTNCCQIFTLSSDCIDKNKIATFIAFIGPGGGKARGLGGQLRKVFK